MLCVAFVVVFTILILRDRPNNSCDKYEEFSVDLKPNRKAKLYTTIWLVRRIAFAIIVVSLSLVSSFTVLLLMTIIQCLLYLVFIIIVRPFSEPKDNTIEIINEIVFTFLVCWQFHFNSKQRWTDTSTQIYMWLICSNNFTVFLIIIGTFIKVKLAIGACIISAFKICRQRYIRLSAIRNRPSKITSRANKTNQNNQDPEQQINQLRPITEIREIEEIKEEKHVDRTRMDILNAELFYLDG